MLTLWQRIKDVTISGNLRLAKGAMLRGLPSLISIPGTNGAVVQRGFTMRKQAAPATATATATLTVAQMMSGIIEATPGAAVAYTMPTGTALLAAMPSDIAPDDSFDLAVLNLGTTTRDITWTASTDITIVGDPVVRPGADSGTEQAGQGVFRLRYVSGVTWVCYRIA